MNLSAQQALETMQRSYAHDAVSIPAPQEQVTYWVGTHLGIAGIDVLIGEGEIDEIIETPATTSIPGTQPWVMGLAAHKGSLLPIVNGDALLRKDVYDGLVREYTMVIRRPTGPQAPWLLAVHSALLDHIMITAILATLMALPARPQVPMRRVVPPRLMYLLAITITILIQGLIPILAPKLRPCLALPNWDCK